MKRITLATAALFALALLITPAVSSAADKASLISNATVKSVTASSLVVTAGGKDSTLAVDAKTTVVGKGIGTKAAAKSKDHKAAITDLLGAGDVVSVTYTGADAAMHATKVELVTKKK